MSDKGEILIQDPKILICQNIGGSVESTHKILISQKVGSNQGRKY